MFYIGGFAQGSNIEVHDMRFAVGAKLSDCYDTLRRDWWGTQESLHLDCWAEINHADGYDIVLSNAPPANNTLRLYFVNLGGYAPYDFSEIHKNVLVVSETASKAKVKALQTILDWQGRHKDNVMEVETAICVNDLLAEQNCFIHLTPAAVAKTFEFTCRYKPLGKQA